MAFKISSLTELAFPPVCESCGVAYFEGSVPYLCDECQHQCLLPIGANFCETCGQHYDGAFPLHTRCSNCSDRELHFDFAISAYQAEGEIMDWMHHYKYGQQIHYARMFGKLLSRVWQDSRMQYADDWLVVPVPLHPRRKRKRGFNQSLEIAREWIRHSDSTHYNLTLANALRRNRHTTYQAALDRNQRLANLADVFVVNPWFRPRREFNNMVIVDDVLTTGTTASECAAVLREAFNPHRIAVVTVLRG